MEDIKVYLRKKNKKSNNEVVNNTKIFQKMKKICWLSIEKNDKMTLIIIIREYFFIKKILSSYKSKYKKLISFELIFEKFFHQTKSAVISCYEKFFILCLITSHPRVFFFILQSHQQSYRYVGKCKNFFQGGIFQEKI